MEPAISVDQLGSSLEEREEPGVPELLDVLRTVARDARTGPLRGHRPRRPS